MPSPANLFVLILDFCYWQVAGRPRFATFEMFIVTRYFMATREAGGCRVPLFRARQRELHLRVVRCFSPKVRNHTCSRCNSLPWNVPSRRICCRCRSLLPKANEQQLADAVPVGARGSDVAIFRGATPSLRHPPPHRCNSPAAPDVTIFRGASPSLRHPPPHHCISPAASALHPLRVALTNSDEIES